MSKLNYYFDKEADVLYFSQGKPQKNIISQEIGDDIIVRKHPSTGEVVGFTILNFIKRGSKKLAAISVPLKAEFTLAK
ncbi:DUF2283 domain-containing protein [Patescibacteria group bacterium]|nr:DUF2283 domain-containing protein [Patescibacteria group bacterium]MBU4512645.1 DUF2283 domain-containing protein [Patescibacteria group bacterium]MCG2693551.1 DUF2283 domain-containing protein [Candidatus Parcubacteria bacterium]